MLKYCGYEDFIKDDSHSFIDKIRAITNQNREDDATNQINYISEEIYNTANSSIDTYCQIKSDEYNPKVVNYFLNLGFSIGYNGHDKTYYISWDENGRPYKR